MGFRSVPAPTGVPALCVLVPPHILSSQSHCHVGFQVHKEQEQNFRPRVCLSISQTSYFTDLIIAFCWPRPLHVGSSTEGRMHILSLDRSHYYGRKRTGIGKRRKLPAITEAIHKHLWIICDVTSIASEAEIKHR